MKKALILILALLALAMPAYSEQIAGACGDALDDGFDDGDNLTECGMQERDASINDNADDIDALQAIDPIVAAEIDTSDELADVLGDEEGTGGGFVRSASPTLTTPNIGTATGASLTLTGALAASGAITGLLKLTAEIFASGDVTLTESQTLGHVYSLYASLANTDDGFTVNLPLAGTPYGESVCFLNRDGFDYSINPNAADAIVINGATLGDGVAIESTASGDIICMIQVGPDANWFQTSNVGWVSE